MQIFSSVIFIAMMILIMTDKMHRTTASILAALLLIWGGVFTYKEAIHYIDFDTIGVLIGMMIFVATIKKSGMFEYVAIKAAKKANGDPFKIMILFTLMTAVLSAFLDNVTTVLLVAPMTIAISRMLEINPVPLLIMQAISSNVGGTATLIGDPPNIMIGNEANLSFIDFIQNTGIAVILILLAQILIMKILYKNDMKENAKNRSAVMNLDETKSIIDKKLMYKGISIMACIVIGFLFHDKIGVSSAAIALMGGAVILAIGKQNVEEIVGDVEWTVILFFASLFIVVGGLEKTGIIENLANLITQSFKHSEIILMIMLLWTSAIISAFLDNIPFVATLIPIIISMKSHGINVEPLWWAISLGACLGGNGTLIGASANVVIAGVGERHGYKITFRDFTKVGFPFMILSIMISTIFLLIKFGI